MLAHRAKSEAGAEPTPSLAALWDEASPALLARAAGGEERVARLRAELVDTSFVAIAELGERGQAELAATARTFCHALCDELEPERKKAERRWVRRALVVLAGVVIVVASLVTFRVVRERLERRSDLAAAAAWKASSNYGVGGCVSPKQDCPESPNYFFHTHIENNPWLVIDLGKVRRPSTVVVRNRLDCCYEQTMPLVVELSTDEKNWTVVGTRKDVFDTWRVKFEKQRARYVRLRLPKANGILHLKSVRVLP